MKKSKVIGLASVGIVLFLCVFFIGMYLLPAKQEAKEIQIGGKTADWEYVERELHKEYFSHLDNTVTYQQIEDEIGKPNGKLLKEMECPYYQINDNLYAVIAFSPDADGGYDTVEMVSFYTKDAYQDTIYPEHNMLTTNFSW